MEIAVVRPGESLWQIARRYGVTTEQIAALNGLRDPNRLVPGLALLIPVERRHVVRPGETLWRIAQTYGTTIDAIARENRLTNVNLIYPGQILVIPRGDRPVIEANAYQANLATGNVSYTAEAAPYLTYISMFSAAVTEDGDVVPPRAENFIAAANRGGAAALLTLTNFRGSTFSSDLASAFLNNDAAVARAIDELVIILRVQGYAGLNVDFEYVYPSDREPYNNFLRRLRPRLHAEGFSLSTAVAPKISAGQPGLLYEAHDYPVHGEVCDFVVLMTYEWGYVTGPPMAIAPLRQVRQVLDYAVTAIPRNKIMMGIPTYGRDWRLPYERGVTRAETFSPVTAVNRAIDVGAAIQFDQDAQSPYYRYWDAQGREHIVWFEDARSLQAKFDTVKEYGLRGVSYWVLGNPFPQNLPLLQDNFRVRRLL
ncbi:LysM peptidoglycan-binding domain-containing protein [Symbiobacterium terraclitae]|uniref:LysM peptidoglycan-binding domain-containing protein n=1 Tax=Symbiobacterium terraclitae TaxID=557451 RepID=UPI0035B521AE